LASGFRLSDYLGGISSAATRGPDERLSGPKNAKRAVAATRTMRREIDSMVHSGPSVSPLAIRDIRTP
jgi:hypothetical protein